MSDPNDLTDAETAASVLAAAEQRWNAARRDPMMSYARFREFAQHIYMSMHHRRATEVMRAHDGKAPYHITVCLGPPRCLFPPALAAGQRCSFCVQCAEDSASTDRWYDVARTIAVGN